MDSAPNPPASIRPAARHDGWTLDRQIAFLSALAKTRSVTAAAAAVGMTRKGAYRFRATRSGVEFGGAWDRILRGPARLDRPANPVAPIPGDKRHSRNAALTALFAADRGKGHEGHTPAEARHIVHPVQNRAP